MDPPVPNTPPPLPPRRSKLPLILGGGAGCLLVLCILLVVAGGVGLNRFRTNQLGPVMELLGTEVTLFTSEPQRTEIFESTPTEAEQPTEPAATRPAPTQPPAATQPPAPTAAAPTSAASGTWSADIGQSLTTNYFSDDFSSDRYDWADTEDDVRFWGIVDGRYALTMKESEWSLWAYLPPEFVPNAIGFDAAVLEGYDQGAYGVICYYVDTDNYHFVEVDPVNQSYSIGYVDGGEYETLLQDMWIDTDALQSDPHAVNQLFVTCDPDLITLTVNNEFVAQAEPLAGASGKMALLGETFSDMTDDSFQVLFDNVSAFKPAE